MPHPSMNVLVLSDFSGKDANVVRDYLYCFNQHSRHHFYYMHSWSKNQFRRVMNFDFNRFDAIVLFWDFYWIGSEDPLSYCHVPSWVADRIAGSKAVKIQFLQDEYRDIRLANRVMSRFGVNLMFSCVAAKDQELFYPKRLIPSLEATYPVLTGYVPSYLEKVNYPASIDRPIDIGYRSRRVPYYLGKLGQEKSIIAERFQAIADCYGFSANISVREEDRIYGEDWLSFMKACRFSLGTESGASVVDFDGGIRAKCQSYLRNKPGASFEEVSDYAFRDIDGKVVVQTISPRIFEAAAFENTLVLHEGMYEGMLEPDVHYISVKKDYSNIEEVVERMKDRPFCERLARNAKEALIDSKRYNYRSFVRQFDEIVESHVKHPVSAGKVSRTMFYLMNYLNNDRIIPHGGVFLSLPHSCDVLYHYNNIAPYAMVLIYSFGLILSLVCQSPRLIVSMIQRAFTDGARSGISIPGILRDLRIVALFLQMRSGLRASHSPPFHLQLKFRSDTNELIANSIPGENTDEDATRSDERKTIELLTQAGEAFTMSWKNESLGNGLPLRCFGSSNYCIFLDEDCVYPFSTINQIRQPISAEERELLTQLLFGGWEEPSLLRKSWVMVYLLWMIGYYFVIEKPARYLARIWPSVFPSQRVESKPTQNEKVEAIH